jgi:hypothetical protein
MSPAQKVNNVRNAKNEVQPVVVERVTGRIYYGFKLSVTSRERLTGKDRRFKLCFQVTPVTQQTPKELTSAVLHDLSVILQNQTKVKNVGRLETIEIDKSHGYWLSCEVNLPGTSPDKLDDKIVSLCNLWLREAKKKMTANRVIDRLEEDTVDDQVEDQILTDQ